MFFSSVDCCGETTEDWEAADRERPNGQQLSENFTTTKIANSESGYWSVGEVTNIYITLSNTSAAIAAIRVQW